MKFNSFFNYKTLIFFLIVIILSTICIIFYYVSISSNSQINVNSIDSASELSVDEKNEFLKFDVLKWIYIKHCNEEAETLKRQNSLVSFLEKNQYSMVILTDTCVLPAPPNAIESDYHRKFTYMEYKGAMYIDVGYSR